MLYYTNRPESLRHLENEESEYLDVTIKNSKKYNWNEKDKQSLKIIAIEFVKNKIDKKYDDVNFPLSEVEILAEEEIINLIL